MRGVIVQLVEKGSAMAKTGGVDRSHDRSMGPKVGFAALHAVVLAAAGWLAISGLLPDRARAGLIFAVAALYFLRQLLTLFVLLQRRVGWGEVLGLAVFLGLVELGFVALGGGVLRGGAVPLGWLDGLALALVLIGSALNSGSELQRWAWKRDPAHKGLCYTGGLFRYAMHINYFGDTVLFTGWALLTLSPLAFALPVFMAASFVWFHIPGLDAYLAERYGDDFRSYAARTAKFVPFLY